MSPPPPRSDYYVYVLFDEHAVPRYVGKGRGVRIKSTLKRTSRNYMKNAFVNRTLKILGDVPTVLVRENLSEKDAFDVEIALIGAIGRHNIKSGPLTNLTHGGDGMTSEEARQLAASFTPMERWLVNKSISDSHLRYSPEERRDRARKREAAQSAEKRANREIKRLSTWFSNHSREQRSRLALKASLAVRKVRWINDGITNKRIAADACVPEDWSAGRIGHTAAINALRIVAVNTRWVTNGSQSRRLKDQAALPSGWFYGRAIIAKVLPARSQ